MPHFPWIARECALQHRRRACPHAFPWTARRARRSASPRRRGEIETRGYKHLESAREQHSTVIDSLRGEVRPPPPPELDSEPERTHLFRFGVNASKKFQCVHCSFRGTYDDSGSTRTELPRRWDEGHPELLFSELESSKVRELKGGARRGRSAL